MPSNSRPTDWMLRVQAVPSGTSRDSLKKNLRSLEIAPDVLKPSLSTVDVRSLARKSKRFLSATVVITTPASPDEIVPAFNQAIGATDLGYRVDNAFDGITPLSGDETDAVCDIVAVPGLNSHPAGSWKTRTRDEMWLRDWLPEDLPNTRVLLYGYDSQLQNNKASSSIEDLSKSLLESLTSFRQDTDTITRPIVFLGHSLGGLLIKEALVESYDTPDNKPQQKSLHMACCGIVFFGVPHWGIRFECLLAIVRGEPNEEFIRSIIMSPQQEPSAYLKRLSKGFGKAFDSETRGHLHVVSIFEKEQSETIKEVEVSDAGTEGKRKKLISTGEFRLLVTEQSATMTGSHGILHGDSIPFMTDHSNLIKFEWRGHDNYIVTRDRIKKIVAEAIVRNSDESVNQGRLSGSQPRLLTNVQGGSTFNGTYNIGDGGSHHIGNNQNNTYFWR